MAKKPQVDIRKLKDEVAEHLKKSRWEKAAEVLAELAAAEPKDMTLRLKVGDTYRKMDQPQMAIEAYRHAAKFFGDEGQLIKAIGAAKIILEIDPRNAEALKQLGDMNKRRLGRISLARIPAPTNHPAAAGRRQGAIELGDSPGTSADLVRTTGIDLPAGGEDEPLELDDGRSIKSPSFRSSMAALAPTPPDEPAGGELELDLGGSPPPLSRGAARQRATAPPVPEKGELGLDLDPDLPAGLPEALPDDAILTPEPEDLVAGPHDEEVIPSDEFGRQGGPIADLLSSSAEEEIELLSISADEELAGSRPTEPPSVSAEEESESLEVTDTLLRELAARYPTVINSLRNFYRQRLLNNVMAISPLFKDFDPSERRGIVEKFRMRQAAPGEKVIVEGKSSDGLYVVLHGSVQVSAKQTEVALLKEGEIFGEMSLLTREPAAATITSPGNSILLRLPREKFQELVVTHPQILALVSELSEKRRSAIDAILQVEGEGHDGMSFV